MVAIAAGYSHSLALRRDGTVVDWGANLSGPASVPEGLASIDATVKYYLREGLVPPGRATGAAGQDVTPALGPSRLTCPPGRLHLGITEARGLTDMTGVLSPT